MSEQSGNTNDRSPLETYEGIYTGKELAGSGKKNGKEWVRYRIIIKQKLTDMYGKTFSAFKNKMEGQEGPYTGGCKGLEDVAEGDYVKLGYSSSDPKPNAKAGRDVVYKTIVWISKSEAATQTQDARSDQRPEQTTDQPTAEPARGVVATHINEIADGYVQACRDCGQQPSENHFIGTVIRNAYEAAGRSSEVKPYLLGFTKACNKPLKTSQKEGGA